MDFWAATIAIGVFVGNCATIVACLIVTKVVGWWCIGRDAWDERE